MCVYRYTYIRKKKYMADTLFTTLLSHFCWALLNVCGLTSSCCLWTSSAYPKAENKVHWLQPLPSLWKCFPTTHQAGRNWDLAGIVFDF